MMIRRMSRYWPVALIVAVAWVLWPRTVAGQGTPMPSPYQTALDNSGRIINNACIWVYAGGTTTPVDTWSDALLMSKNTNPIRSDSAGRFTAFLSSATYDYKFVYETACVPPSHGTVLKTVDNVVYVPIAQNAVMLANNATAGENIASANCAYLSDGSGGKTAGRWYNCDSANTYSSITPLIGIAATSCTAAALCPILIAGEISGATTAGLTYYVGGSGAITSTAPSNRRIVGYADATGALVVSGFQPPLVLPNPVTQDLLFTDATYDIGKTGATRPRNLFISGTATIGAQTVGSDVFTFSKNQNATSTFTIQNTDTTNTSSKAIFAATAGTSTIQIQAIGGGSPQNFGTTTGQALQLLTNGSIGITISALQAIRFNAYGAGTITSDGSGNLTAVSDERLKHVDGPFGAGLAAIKRIDPICYHWTPASGFDLALQYCGFGAANVRRAIPSAVAANRDGYLSLQDRPIIAALVNSVKELSAEVDDLKAEVAALKAKGGR